MLTLEGQGATEGEFRVVNPRGAHALELFSEHQPDVVVLDALIHRTRAHRAATRDPTGAEVAAC